MAAGDAIFIPLKNTAYRAQFPIFLNTSLLCTGWTGAAATIIKDGASAVAATNTPTENGAANGIGYLDLTAAEMNYTSISLNITVTNANAVPTVMVIPIATASMIQVNLVSILGTALTETTGQIAAAFKKFFNIATPTLTTGGTDQTGDSYARLGAPAGASIAADIAEVEAETDALLVGVNVSSIVAGVAAADVLNATAASYNTAGSIGQKINSAGALGDPLANAVPGSYAAGTAGNALGNIPAIKAKTDSIGSGNTVYVSPINPLATQFTIVQGDDYLATDGRSIDITFNGFPSFSGGAPTFTAKLSGQVFLNLNNGSGIMVLSSNQLRLQLTKTQTGPLPVAQYLCNFTVTLADGSVVTADIPTMNVIASGR